MDYNLQKVCGNTYVIGTNLTIPVYFLNEREVVLLDSGYANPTRRIIDSFLEASGVKVRAVMTSHLHYDHVGNHKYLQETFGSELIAHEIEAAVMTDYSTVSAYYPIGSCMDWKKYMPELCARIDRTFSSETKEIEIDGSVFGLVHLPGHTYGHTGIITPDDVFYVGDAVICPEEMELAKIPTTMNWKQDFASKEMLCGTEHKHYVLAHSGFCDNIQTVAKQNIAARQEKLRNIYRILSESRAKTMEDMLTVLADRFQIIGTNLITQAMFQRNFQYLLDYYLQEGCVERGFEHGVFVYRYSAKPLRDDCSS